MPHSHTARALSVLFITIMLIGLAPAIHSVTNVHAQATPQLFIAPSHQDLATAGSTVTYSINVSNISPDSPLGGWVIFVQTNRSVLSPISISLGSFLAGASETTECINAMCSSGSPAPDDSIGVVHSEATTVGSGNSGNGTLFTITYNATNKGVYSSVDFLGPNSLQETFLSDPNGIVIQVIPVGADYGTVPPLSTASFTFSPLRPFAGEPVTFNATSSQAAPGHKIAFYFWTFAGYQSNIPVSNPITRFSFQAPGNLTVSLVVTDDRGGGLRSRAFQRTINVALKPRIDLSIVNGLSAYPVDNILAGTIVTITVLVTNLGTVAETGFNVSVSVAGRVFTAPAFRGVVTPGGLSNPATSFAWNTTGLAPDTYIIHARVETLPGENNTANNDAYFPVRLIYPFNGATIPVSLLQFLGLGLLGLIGVGSAFSALGRIRNRREEAREDIL